MKKDNFTAAVLSLGIGLGISSCNSCDSGKYGKVPEGEVSRVAKEELRISRITDCGNMHMWEMLGHMREQLKEECENVRAYKSGEYPADRIARAAREGGMKVDDARRFWEWGMGRSYGPATFGTAEVAASNSGGTYTVHGGSYAIKEVDSGDCGATVVFTFRVKDGEGHPYRVRQTMKFDFIITDLDAAETGGDGLDPRSFTGWVPSLNHPFGVADEQIFKGGGKKKGLLEKIFGDLEVQRPPAKFLRRSRAADARNMRATPARKNCAQGRLARAARS